MLQNNTQKGKTLESYINKLVNIVNSNGGHAHKNHTQRTPAGIPILHKGEPWDYEFFGRKHLYFFDAKECKKHQVNLRSFFAKETNLRQFNALNAVSSMRDDDYFQCGFLFWFMNTLPSVPNMPPEIPGSLIFFPVGLISRFWHDEKKYLSYDDGIHFFPAKMLHDCVGLNFTPSFD